MVGVLSVPRPRWDEQADQVSYELARELASTVVNAHDLQLPLRDLYGFSHPETGATPDEDEIVKYLKENFPLVTVPLNTPLVRDYQAETTKVKADIAPYQKSYPGLFRVLSSNAQILSNVLRNEKEIARDDDLWRAVLPKIIHDTDRVRSFEHMKGLLGDVLTQAVMQHMQNSERQIELLNHMLDLVMDIYFDQSPKDLVKMSRRERSEKVVPVTRTERITEDLAEAKKCLQHVFTRTSQVERYDGGDRDSRPPGAGLTPKTACTFWRMRVTGIQGYAALFCWLKSGQTISETRIHCIS